MSVPTTPAASGAPTFAARLDALAQRQPDATALIDRGQPLSTAALRDTANRLAAALA